MTLTLDPSRDLVLDRLLAAPPALVWRCWTEPELICKWFCPKPWFVSQAVVDLRPGGRFFTLMNGPDGEVVPNEGSFLEVVPLQKLVFTDVFGADYTPVDVPESGAGLSFAAILTFAAEGTGTRYRAVARHRNSADAQMHETMGFQAGWGAAATQLEELAQGL
jgi:uncharacterized protein YndB with AHSA1/START domain